MENLNRKKQIETEADIRFGCLSFEARAAWIEGVRWADRNNSYETQLKWQISAIHDVCGFLRRCLGEKATPYIGMIKNYFNLEHVHDSIESAVAALDNPGQFELDIPLPKKSGAV